MHSIRNLAGTARRWAHAHRIFHMDALGLIMNIAGSSGLRIVAANSNYGSCTINANGAVYAIGTATRMNYEDGAATTLYAFAITSDTAKIFFKTGPSASSTYTLKLTASEISLTSGDPDTSINITVIGLA